MRQTEAPGEFSGFTGTDWLDHVPGWLKDPVAHRRALETFLKYSRRPVCLLPLDSAERIRWSELAVQAIRATDHRLDQLLRWRAAELGDHPLFQDLLNFHSEPSAWSYHEVEQRTRRLAATLWSLPRKGTHPVVLLWAENSIDVALADLSCLQFDILVAPLNTSLEQADLEWIVARLQPDITLVDTPSRRRRLETIPGSGMVLALDDEGVGGDRDVEVFAARATRPGLVEIESILKGRPRLGMDEACTVMFTSGSTGQPKGVVFTPMNLISKRYCRAAALPAVGDDERMLCYLPLYHTFGRFLEMLGSIFWGGTYVFASNPSFETLREGMRTVRPTGLISIPRRWQQIREASLATGESAASLTGGSLRWGLSAAGHLEPRVFRFFHREGIEVCSGFGMTEATGGITMSPPGQYIDETVGSPLPGIELGFEDGEMLIRGPYVARYLDADGKGMAALVGESFGGSRGWLRTGDLFRELDSGQLQIVDRLKDIYKNSQGQTIAPRRVENLFEGVAGIRRVFLVGDHRPHNVLLISPDSDDAVMRDAPDELSRHAYLASVIASANARLAPFERIVDFGIIDREFLADRGELTSKGGFRRKRVEENFADTIERLYRQPRVEISLGDLTVQLPTWLLRDLGSLAEDFVARGAGLLDRRRDRWLRIWRVDDQRVGVGDLIYRLEGAAIDLGQLVRQPSLWLGNPALIWFGGTKDGWDVGYGEFQRRIWIPENLERREDFRPIPPAIEGDPLLLRIDEHLQNILHLPARRAVLELDALGEILESSEPRLDRAARRRLDALAEHPDEAVRCAAFRVLLIEKPAEGYSEAFGTFLESGRSFLTTESVRQISTLRFGRRQLELLRQRMGEYRAQTTWPVRPEVRAQLAHIFDLLVDFAREDPDHYHAIRCELANWVILDRDPALADAADHRLRRMVKTYEVGVERRRVPVRAEQVVFAGDVPPERIKRQLKLLTSTGFLQQAVELAFADPRFDPKEIPERGLWINRAYESDEATHYRWSLRTNDGRQRNLLVILRDDLESKRSWDTICWMLAIAGYPFAERRIPRFGCARPELGAMALEWVDQLTVAERIREAAARTHDVEQHVDPEWCRQVFVGAIAALVQLWVHSGRRLLPGSPSPENVTVPALDFRPGTRVLSLGNWKRSPRSQEMIETIYREFFERTRALSPELENQLDPTWIAEAWVEALGEQEAREILGRCRAGNDEYLVAIRSYLESGGPERHVPLAVESAIRRFGSWHALNPEATADALLDEIDELLSLYNLEPLGEFWRYYLFRATLFAAAPPAVRAAFDELLAQVRRQPAISPTHRVELSRLQDLIEEDDLRIMLSRLVFPRSARHTDVDMLTWGEPGHEQVTVRTRIQDNSGVRYDVREPVNPEEIGQIYRLFYRDHYARPVSEADRFLIAMDIEERVVAALIFRPNRPGVVHLDGIVVRTPLSGRGIGSALIEDFAVRCEGRNVGVMRTNFILRRFCERRGFHVDRRWGGLVRFLGTTTGDEI